MSLYDTSSIEALLAQQEEEWTEKVRKRRERHQTGAAGADGDGSENGLQLSAHSSADQSSSGPASGDEGYDPYRIGGGKQGGQKGSGNHKKVKGSNPKPEQGAVSKKKRAKDEENDEDEDEDESAVPLAPRYAVTLPQLVETATLLKRRFKAFADSHPQVKGLSRLERRFDKELSLAETAMARAQKQAEEEPKDTTVGADGAPKKEDGRQPYDRCNGLLLLEILLACVENEQDVAIVIHGEPLKDTGAPAWSRQFVDVDVVSQGGSRWIRVKGTSLRNLEADFQGNSERKPFVATAKNFSRAAANHLLPFGRHPSTVIMLSELPADDEPDPKLAKLRDTVRSELQGEAGITSVESYFSPQLNLEVESQADMYAIDDSDKGAWAVSLAPEAVEERLLAHQRLWPKRGPHLPYNAPQASIPKLINFDVTALVACCSDTCHSFDLSTLFTLDEYAVLRRQVEDERVRETLKEHVYPCLDRYTIPGAPRWWHHWHHDDTLPECGNVCKLCGPVETTSETSLSLGPNPLPFPFTHDQLVDYIDSLALRPVEGEEGTSEDGTQKKISDIIWTKEQHEEERAKDKEFPYRFNWVMSEVAMTEFSWILRTISGPMELPRAERLLRFFHVIPTDKFVHVPTDPIFVAEAETASQRKERRRNEEKMQRRKYAEQCEESKLHQPQHVPKGLNRQCLIALDAAVKAGVPDASSTKPTSPTSATPTDGCSTDFPVGTVSATRSNLQSATPPPEDIVTSSPISPTTASAPTANSPSFTLFDYLPTHANQLECTGKIKARHKAVFGLGDAIGAITLTANEQFVQAAGEQYVSLNVLLHCSRALIGKKVASGLAKRASANATASASLSSAPPQE